MVMSRGVCRARTPCLSNVALVSGRFPLVPYLLQVVTDQLPSHKYLPPLGSLYQSLLLPPAYSSTPMSARHYSTPQVAYAGVIPTAGATPLGPGPIRSGRLADWDGEESHRRRGSQTSLMARREYPRLSR